ncbi:MAG TPA: cytochrome c oxidase subunit 4, partial [Beutenbergiaceae bacterium]|nr:cytochrome c oxidase subunit 4 [Beutenbergiaceae bacterium]
HMTEQPQLKNRKPMRDEAWFFVGLTVFFIFMTVFYGVWTAQASPDGIEWAGTTALALLVGLNGMAGFYLWKLSGEVDERPEDVALAEIEDYAGDYHRFSPWSWSPLLLGVSATLLFLGPALHQWWLWAFAGPLGAFSLWYAATEFNRGPNRK